MAKIRKRDNSYQIDYFDPNGKRVRKSFRKRKDAEAELGKRVSLKAEGRYLDVKKDYKTTLGELLDKYTEMFEGQASFHNSKRYFIRNFRDYFGEDTLLANIKYVDIETYQAKLKKKLTPHSTKRKESSINREMVCLHHVFDKAVEWDMLEKNPFDKGGYLWLKENNRRTRFLDEDEIDQLLDNCVNPWIEDIVNVAINAGMRRKELLGLKRKQIRDGFIYLSETKTDEARQIEINDDLEEILKDIKQRNQLKSEYVFCDEKGRHINAGRLDYAFEGSLKRAGIEDFTFHDLRHTFASHFVMRGGSLKGLQAILGHKDLTMTMRYAHLSTEHRRKEVNLLNGLTRRPAVHVTPVSHPARKA